MIAVAEVEEVKGFLVAGISDSLLTLFLNIILVELIYIFFFLPHYLACRILVPQPGIKPGPWQ